MKRRLAIMAILVAAMIALSTMLSVRPAQARGPKWSPVPSAPFDIPAGYCAFPVHGDVLESKEYMTVVTRPDGTEIDTITGSAMVRLTNTNTGKSIDLNVSGPGTLTFYPDGSASSVSLGNGLSSFASDEQQQFGVPGIAYTSGRFTTTYVPNGSGDYTLVSVTTDGTITDVCALLS